jgi:hypothetical protein
MMPYERAMMWMIVKMKVEQEDEERIEKRRKQIEREYQ